MMPPTVTEVHRLLVSVRAALVRQDIAAAKSAIFEAIKLAQRDRAYDEEHRAWMLLAITQRANGEHKAALSSFLAAESAARAAKDVLALVDAGLSRCACLSWLGRWREALTLRGDLARAHGDEVMAQATSEAVNASTLMSLGSAYLQIDVSKACVAYERALTMVKETKVRANAYLGLGYALERSGRPSEALAAYTCLAELSVVLNQPDLVKVAQNGIARAKGVTNKP